MRHDQIMKQKQNGKHRLNILIPDIIMIIYYIIIILSLVHIFFHVCWMARTHYCDLALVIVVFNYLFIHGLFVVFWVKIFLITAIVSD